MPAVRDTWYIRLPDDRELKAKSTAAVLHHLRHGHIPKNSLARRSRTNEWMQLEWHAEFTEAVTGHGRPKPVETPAHGVPQLLPPSGIADRLDPLRLRTVGVRGLWEDLIAALDSTFVRGKLTVAAMAGIIVGLLWGVVPWAFMQVMGWLGLSPLWPERFIFAVATVVTIIVLAWTNGLLARMTHVELSLLRPARWREAAQGYFDLGFRLTLAYLLVLGGSFLLMRFVYWVPVQLYEQSVLMVSQAGAPTWLAEVLPAAFAVFGVVVSILLWMVVGLTWLLAPLLVVEDYSLFRGINEWYVLVRDNLNRILLAQSMALAVGVLVTIPFAAPICYAAYSFPHLPTPLVYAAYGAALAPFVAFMTVANAFIYLDVKYERAN